MMVLTVQKKAFFATIYIFKIIYEVHKVKTETA